MPEFLILVDEFGQRTGIEERLSCHNGAGQRHLAFVIFLVANDGKLLLQKRAASKLGGDRWDVSATSHVRVNETYAAAIERCLQHELGVTESLEPEYRLAYVYQEQLGDRAENEFCSLFVLRHDGVIVANPEEIDEIRWIDPAELKTWYETDPSQFTRWFAETIERMGLADSTM